jgi:putative membrane protein
MALLNLLPRRAANDGVPILMLAWVYFSSVFANLVFFDRPGVAIWGGLAMGIVVIPYLWRSWSEPL